MHDEALALGRWFLRFCDPGFDSYWVIESSRDPYPTTPIKPFEPWRPGDPVIYFDFFTRTAANSEPSGDRKRAYYMSQQLADPLAYYSLTRFANLTQNSVWLLYGDGDNASEKSKERDATLLAAVTTPSAARFSFTPRFSVTPIDFNVSGKADPPPRPTGVTGFQVRINYLGLNATVPLFLPMPPRKPRKWGRVLTPKWEAEHAQIVAARKFKRNANKAKKGKLPRMKPTPDEQCALDTNSARYAVKLAALGTLNSAVKRIQHPGRRAAARKVQAQVVRRLAKIRAPKKQLT